MNCVACEGTGVSSRGRPCSPCAGTGQKKGVSTTLDAPLFFDVETHLIKPARTVPPLVCMSVEYDGDVDLYDKSAAVEVFEGMLDSGRQIVGHNVAFDLAVMCRERPEFLPRVFDAYEEGRIGCTMIRQKLIDLAEGRYYGYFRLDDKYVKIGYGLDDLCLRLLGYELPKTEIRLQYDRLDGVPLDEWPELARDYAMTDSAVTSEIWCLQQADKTWRTMYLHDQYRQCCAAWWIQLMQAWGLRTDPGGVEQFAAELQAEFDQKKGLLIQHGLMRPNGVRNTKVAAAHMVKACMRKGVEVVMTSPSKKFPKGQVSLSAEHCEATGDEVMHAYAEISSLKKQLSTDIPLLQQGTVVPIHPKWESIKETGRTGTKPNVQNVPVYGKMRECFVPRPGMVFAAADYDGFELRTMSQFCISKFGKSKLAEALNAGLDPHLVVASRLLKISYGEAKRRKDADDDEVYRARQTGKVCFHPDTEVLTRSGWREIADLDPDEEVCSAVLGDDGSVEMEWEVPLALTSRRFDGDLVHLKNEGIDLRVTPDHRMCGWRRVRYRDGRVVDRVVTVLPDELKNLRYWPNAGNAPGTIEEDERLLRLAVAVQADGNYTDYGKIRLGFTKRRKIDRLRSLLREGEYRFRLVGQLKVSTFHLEDREFVASIKRLLTPEKTLPWWWVDLVPRLREVVLEEARFWDSNTPENATSYGYSTIIEENADILQALGTLTGKKTRKTTTKRAPYEDAYKVSVKLKHRSRGGNLDVSRIRYAGDVFCLTTRNDTVVVRDGGVPVITRQCNFGMPGGLGAESLVVYAKSNYNVDITEEEAKKRKEEWLESWPEFRTFFAYFGQLCDQAEPQFVQLFSNRFRGDVHFTEAANSSFQGLAADAAKAAGFLIAKACYVETESPLYGSRIVNFIHDEFILESPEDRAAEAAEELAKLMVKGASVFLPDVPPKASPLLMRRWSKKAKEIRDDNGRLVPWDNT